MWQAQCGPRREGCRSRQAGLSFGSTGGRCVTRTQNRVDYSCRRRIRDCLQSDSVVMTQRAQEAG